MFLISRPTSLSAIIIFLIAFACIVLPIFAIIDLSKRDITQKRIVWLLIILFLPVVGSIAFFYSRDALK
jgi:hypothetical protein